MDHIRAWLNFAGTHQFNNVWAVHFLCHVDQLGTILDKHGKTVFTLEEFCDDMGKVESLKGKPKIFFLLTCHEGQSLQSVLLEAKC